MKYLVVANGIAIDDNRLARLVSQSDVVVCVDGGAKHLKRINFVPDVLIGDMDSIGDDLSLYFTDHLITAHSKAHVTQKQSILIKYPEQKDASDTELAVLWAIDHGATYITLTGVTGTRMDHTLSNIFLLRTIIQKGVGCKIVDGHNEIFLLSHITPPPGPTPIETGNNYALPLGMTGDGQNNYIETYRMSINGNLGELLSIIPVTEEVVGLTLKGLEYPLNDATLTLGTSRGVSNVFTEDVAHISLKHGAILVIKSRD